MRRRFCTEILLSLNEQSKLDLSVHGQLRQAVSVDCLQRVLGLANFHERPGLRSCRSPRTEGSWRFARHLVRPILKGIQPHRLVGVGTP